MNNYKIIYPFLIFSILFFCGCKKTGKEILEKVSKESVERTGREIAKESSERTLRTISKKELKNIDWRELLKLIRKENINLAESLQKLDGSFQKKIGKAIKNDYEFYSALVSSNTFVDEFAVLAKGAPKVADDINIFKYFVKCRDMERRFGVPNSVSNLSLKEEMGVIKFLDKGTNKVLGEFKDGVYLIKEPFKKGASLLDNSSVLKKTLIPNSVYKIKGANGLIYLYHVDELGRFSKIEAKGVNADELVSNIILAKENLNLGSEWAAQLKKIRQTSKGSDIDATIVLKYADDGTTPLAVKADVKANNKKIIAQSFENLDEVAQSGKKNLALNAIKIAEGDLAIDLLVKKKYKNIIGIIDALKMQSPQIFSKKNLVVTELSDGSLSISYKGSVPGTFSEINIKGNKIKAKGGSLAGENSAQNQFLNKILPNMIYDIDGFVTYKTDHLGRVIEATADRTKLERANILRAGRASETQAAIRKSYPGHDGGHLIDCASGGANEIINQVPMESKFNRRGDWRKMELMENKAVKEGKQVKVTRKLLYSDDSTRPTKIISEIEIDGEKSILSLENPLPA